MDRFIGLRAAACALALAGASEAQQPAPAASDVRPAGPLEQARALAAEKKWKEVRRLAEEALKADPQSAGGHELLGLALHAQKRCRGALAELELAAQGGVEAKAIARAAAECAERRKDRGRQVRWFLVLAKEEKDQSAALKAAAAADAPRARLAAYELAQSLGQLPATALAPFARAAKAAGRTKQAATLFVQAAAAAPDDSGLQLEAGRALLAAGDIASAEEKRRQLSASRPSDADVMLFAADVARARGDATAERKILEDLIASRPEYAPAQMRLGQLLQAGGDLRGARERYAAAIAAAPQSAEPHRLASAAALLAGDTAAALSEGRAAIKLAPKDAPAHLALANAASAAGETAEALSEYEKVLAHDKSNAEANAASGRILAKRGSHKEAQLRLSRAFAARRDDAQLGAELANAQLGTKDLAAAQKTLAQIRTDQLDPATLHGLKGRVESALGNYRKAHEEYEKALKTRPGDAELLALDGENFLKLPDYDRAIGRLEAAAKADPSRLGVARELSRLYAETGQANKVAESVARVENLERKQLEERRKTIDPRLVKRIAVGEAFKGEGLSGFGVGLRDSLAGDLARSPFIQIIDTKNREGTDRERDRLAQRADLSPEELAKVAAKEQAPQGVLGGLYALAGGELTVSARILDLHNNLLAGHSATGPKEQYAQLEKRVALNLLDKLGVRLDADELAALQRLEGTPSLDSFAYTAAAAEAVRKGDMRSATSLYQRAREIDQGNAEALLGLERSLAEVEKKNRIAVPTPQTQGEIDAVSREMFRRTLTDKLSAVRGLHVVETERVAEVDAELDRITGKDADNIDPKSVDLQALGKRLAANVLVRTTMQKEGDQLQLTASLVDISDQKLLTGAESHGPAAQRQRLQADLARQIVQQLRGEPTDEERVALEATMKEEEYQQKMAKLAELLEKERREKEAVRAPPPVVAQAAVAAAPKAVPAVEKKPIAAAAPPPRPTPPAPRSRSEEDYYGDQWTVGYTAHFLIPNGSALSPYKTFSVAGKDAFWQHGVTLMEQGSSFSTGVWLSYGSSNASAPASGSFSHYEGSWVFLWNVLSRAAPVSPYLGGRVGVTGVKAQQVLGSDQWGFSGAVMAGLDLQFGRHFVVRLGGGYDATFFDVGNSAADPAGFAVDSGAILKF